MANPNFRNVSFITSLNYYQDKMNDLVCERFATKHGQQLTHFYSIDRYKAQDGEHKLHWHSKGIDVNPQHKSNKVTPKLQKILWHLPPASTQHHSGKLSLCIGMPVMIKKNKATACSVTNGAEGVVVGWTTHSIDASHNALDVLFVKLTSPPRPLQLQGLPLNVVPVMHESMSTSCLMPDGGVRKTLIVTRCQ